MFYFFAVRYKRKYVHEVLVNCLFKLAQEKVWLGDRTVTLNKVNQMVRDSLKLKTVKIVSCERKSSKSKKKNRCYRSYNRYS